MSEVMTDWIIGWKVAYAYCAEDQKTLQFVPIHQNGIIVPHGMDARAECQQHPWHVPPMDGCRCGFNAWHDSTALNGYRFGKQPLAGFDTRGMKVVLRVGLYGDVIEGTLHSRRDGSDEWGYRASHQRVADVFFSRQCYKCEAATERIALTCREFALGWILRPVCSRHVDHYASMSVRELAEANGIDVHWHWYTSE